jgi:RNA polymerase sigma factor (TIGR02999 family)
MVDAHNRSWENRAHFFAAAAGLMRQILVDYARARRTEKRGGGRKRIALENLLLISQEKFDEILAIDSAVVALNAVDARKARVVEMRYFAGMTAEETAEALATTVRTVERDWAFARAWLQRELDAARPASG